MIRQQLTSSAPSRRAVASGLDRYRRRRPCVAAPSLERLEDRRLLVASLFAKGFGSVAGDITVSIEAEKVDSAGNIFITGGFNGTVSFGSTTLTRQGLDNIFVARLTQSGTVVWAKQMGSSSQSQGDYGRGIALDANDNVLVTGFYAGTAQFGGFTLSYAGQRDIFAEKLDPNGNVLWAEGFGGAGDDLGQSVAVDGSGNAYVTGSYQDSVAFGGTTLTTPDGSTTNVFVTKLNAGTGAVVWATQLGSSGMNSGYGIGLDGSSNVYVTGNFTNTAQFGSTTLTSRGDSDIFVTKLSNGGAVSWAVGEGGLGHDDGVALAVDSNGNSFVTGDFVGPAKFGSFNLTSAGQDDAFVERLDTSGNVIWANHYGGSSFDAGFGITLDSIGEVYTTGVFQGTAGFGSGSLTSVGGYDVYLTKSDSNGNLSQAIDLGSTQTDQAYQVAVGGPKSNITLVGDYGAAFFVHNNGLASTGSGYVIGLSQTPALGGAEALSDFDTVGYSQVAVYRPATAQWFAVQQTGSQPLGAFGGNQDVPVAGDYDSLGRSELAVYRPSTAQWFVQGPGGVTEVLGPFGGNGDIPVPGDYDGVGHTELAVFRPSTAQWFVQSPHGTEVLGPFGGNGDIASPGDYDGIGHTELAVYRPSTSQWFVQGAGGATHILGPFGGPGDVPVPGDYDGVGYTELGIFRPSTAQWFVLGPVGGHLMTTFGATGLSDIPTETSAGTYLGGGGGSGFGLRIPSPGGGLHASSIGAPASGTPPALTTLSGVGSAPVTRASAVTSTTVVTTPAVSVLVPSSVLGKKDAWSAAIDDLFS